ncbi:unnamed protein product [Candidula unifasciata]|uniref:Thioredoxin domain-containing protein n=1 Tax=Candidula unifasciata TaxID=100452 RepID=A0A8S3ZZH8_9EUPU|nr:unnamed protein product [Candidula unifasciata]
MSAPEAQIIAPTNTSSVQLNKPYWQSLQEYPDMKPLFSGQPTRFQLLKKFPTARRHTQTSKQLSSPPRLPDATATSSSLPVTNTQSHKTVKIPAVRTHGLTVSPDPFFGSDFVYSLNALNSREFLMRKAAVLVLFYCPHDKDISEIKKHYTSSASSTKRENHAYAAVDCTLEPELCTAFGITFTPFVAYYSRGIKIDSGLVESKEFVKDDLRFFMEQAPIYNDPKLKGYGRLALAKKTLQGIKSPGRKPPQINVSPKRKSSEFSESSQRKSRGLPNM